MDDSYPEGEGANFDGADQQQPPSLPAHGTLFACTKTLRSNAPSIYNKFSMIKSLFDAVGIPRDGPAPSYAEFVNEFRNIRIPDSKNWELLEALENRIQKSADNTIECFNRTKALGGSIYGNLLDCTAACGGSREDSQRRKLRAAVHPIDQ